MLSRHNRAMAFAILGSRCSNASGWTPAGKLAAHFAVAGKSWFNGCSLRLFLSSEDEFNGVLSRQLSLIADPEIGNLRQRLQNINSNSTSRGPSR
jgi:hypothetical protein